MTPIFTRKRLSMTLAVFGVVLMGVDLMLTRNFFTHIGELMVASLLCFAAAIYLDRSPAKSKDPKDPKAKNRCPLGNK